MLSFTMQAWGQLLAIILPPESMALISGAILLCLNLLFSGVTKPSTFAEIYNNPKLASMVGILSPTRYFVETLVVSDVLCLPNQFGFTKSSNATSIEFTAFDILGLAQNDKDNIQQDCHGWYYAFPRLFMTGLMLRVLSLLMINFTYGSNGRGSWQLLRGHSKSAIVYLLLLCTAFILLLILNIQLILT